MTIVPLKTEVTINNGTVYLRVKIKSLADEARTIKREERLAKKRGLTGYQSLHDQLYRHRIDVVRAELRATQLAYGFVLGLEYKQMENTCHTMPDWKRVKTLLQKYAPKGFALPAVTETSELSQLAKFQ